MPARAMQFWWLPARSRLRISHLAMYAGAQWSSPRELSDPSAQVLRSHFIAIIVLMQSSGKYDIQ
jgi:hypothetical protein